MKIFVKILTAIIMITSCKQNKCPSDQVSYLKVNQTTRDYFPYKLKQTVNFTKYIDSTNIGLISFSADTFTTTPNSIIGWHDCGNGNMYSETKITENFGIKLSNQTELGKDCNISITSDVSELDINLYGIDFELSDFENAIVYGQPFYNVDSIIINNKNYGKGFCISPSNPTKIYFNSKYGLLKYVNESTKEQLIYTE